MSEILIPIEVAFATAKLQKIISLQISPDTTILNAIRASGIASFFPEYDFSVLAIGVFGKRIFEPNTYQFKPGDRLEIYRPLAKTPNQRRLDRAKQK